MLYHMRRTRGVQGIVLCIEGEYHPGVSRDQHGLHKETVKGGGSRSVFDKYEVKGHSSELGER